MIHSKFYQLTAGLLAGFLLSICMTSCSEDPEEPELSGTITTDEGNIAITIPLANKAPRSGAKANAAVGGAGASIAFV